MVRKYLPYLAAIILAIAIYVGGAYTGISLFGKIKSTTYLQDEFIKSSELTSLLVSLDKHDTEQARQYLLLQQDASILTINDLLEYSDDASYKTGCNILKRIAKHRKDHPELYSTYKYGIDDKNTTIIRNKISEILIKWDSYESCAKK